MKDEKTYLDQKIKEMKLENEKLKEKMENLDVIFQTPKN
jgi:hypothetical protein